MKKIIVVGLGKQSEEDHLPAIEESHHHKLVGVCDINEDRVNQMSLKYKTNGFTSLDKVLKVNPDMAIVAIPHSGYKKVLEQLAYAKIHLIKEKPFATCFEEANLINQLVRTNNVFLGITLQRRFNPIFQTFSQLKKRIGKIFSIEGKYCFNIKQLDEGWRAKRSESGGGALIDMGYHFIDLLIWYMGLPSCVSARTSTGNREGQEYDVEDTVHLIFDYDNKENGTKTIGNFVISRVYPTKIEELFFYGTEGIIHIKRGLIERLDSDGRVIEKLSREGGWPSAAVDQLEFFTKCIDSEPGYNYNYQDHFLHLSVIEAAYESDKSKTSINPSKYLTAGENCE